MNSIRLKLRTNASSDLPVAKLKRLVMTLVKSIYAMFNDMLSIPTPSSSMLTVTIADRSNIARVILSSA